MQKCVSPSASLVLFWVVACEHLEPTTSFEFQKMSYVQYEASISGDGFHRILVCQSRRYLRESTCTFRYKRKMASVRQQLPPRLHEKSAATTAPTTYTIKSGKYDAT
ncbi:hypothetical protein V8C42DRAFT_312281 [Trichoderma barbatum]